MAVPFLDLETKEDYLDQVVALAGLPTKFKYTAEEWNLIRDKVNELHQILGNTELGDAANNNINVEFKYLDVDWSQQVAYNTFVKTKLNNSPALEVTGNDLYIFYAIKNVSSFVQGGNFIAEKHLWIFRKGRGTYGSNETQVHENDFIYLGHQKNSSPSLQRYLFDIGNTPISEVINLGTETYAINLGMYNIFNCTRNGDPYSYVFVTSFNVIGNYQNVPESRQVYESSFLEIANTDPIPPSLDNFVTLQELYDSMYDNFHFMYTDYVDNFNLSSENFYLIEAQDEETFYFASKITNPQNLKGTKLGIRQTGYKFLLGDPTDTFNGYHFWDIGDLPNDYSLDTDYGFQLWDDFKSVKSINNQIPDSEGKLILLGSHIDIDSSTLIYSDAHDLQEFTEDTDANFAQVYDDLSNKADKYARVNISSSGNLLPVHNGKLLIITGSVTLTYSGIYPDDFNFNIKVLSGGQLTIAKGDKILKDTEGNSVAQLVAEEHSFATSYEVATGEYMMEGNLS